MEINKKNEEIEGRQRAKRPLVKKDPIKGKIFRSLVDGRKIHFTKNEMQALRLVIVERKRSRDLNRRMKRVLDSAWEKACLLKERGSRFDFFSETDRGARS